MEGVFLFKINDLHSLYTKRLADLGIEKCINKTVLKQSILDYFKTAHSQYDGKGTIIVFSEGMQAMLKTQYKIVIVQKMPTSFVKLLTLSGTIF